MRKGLDQVHSGPVVQPGLTGQAQNSHDFQTVPLSGQARGMEIQEPSPLTLGPTSFLSMCPSAGYVAKAKTLISFETNPAASLFSLSVNRLGGVGG